MANEILNKGYQLDERGGLALTTLDDQLRFADHLLTQKMISDSFKTPQQVVIGFQYAKALGVPEILALRMMYVINGRPALFGDGPLSLVQRTGLITSLKEFYINEKGDEICFQNKNLKDRPYASITQVARRDQMMSQEDFFSLDDMEVAKINMNNFGKVKDVWAKFERIMIRYKARSMALKSKFTDVLAGIPIAEYDDHFSPETPNIVNVKSSVAADLEKAYPPGDADKEYGIIEIGKS